MNILDDNGTPIDATFTVTADGGDFLVHLASRGGGRNNQYRLGLITLLRRAATLAGEIPTILVASKRLEDRPPSDRIVNVDRETYPIRLAEQPDLEDLAGRIGRGIAAVGRVPGASGEGNRTKRIEIRLRCDWTEGEADGLAAQLRAPGQPSITHGVSSEVTRAHLLAAIAWLDEGRGHLFSESVKFDVLHEDRRYPPKAVVGIASEIADGHPRGPASFHAGVESTCFRTLERNGFKIAPKPGAPTFPDELDDASRFEGASKRVTVNRYERDPKAREQCIRHYGAVCQVCRFDFGEVYGGLGDGFIHVHHVFPISQVGAEYRVDPVADLRPVCPNCHAMLHRAAGATLSVEELREVMKRQR